MQKQETGVKANFSWNQSFRRDLPYLFRVKEHHGVVTERKMPSTNKGDGVVAKWFVECLVLRWMLKFHGKIEGGSRERIVSYNSLCQNTVWQHLTDLEELKYPHNGALWQGRAFQARFRATSHTSDFTQNNKKNLLSFKISLPAF